MSSTLQSDVSWQIDLATWLHSLASQHAPSVPLLPLQVVLPNILSDTSLTDSSSGGDGGVDSQEVAPSGTVSTGRMSLQRVGSNETHPAAVSSISNTSPSSAIDASRIHPQQYALRRPQSGARPLIARPPDVSYVPVQPGRAAAPGGLFPTLVQAHVQVNEGGLSSGVAALPSTQSPLAPNPSISYHNHNTTFIPLAALSNPASPSASKSAPQRQISGVPGTNDALQSVRSTIHQSIQALVSELVETKRLLQQRSSELEETQTSLAEATRRHNIAKQAETEVIITTEEASAVDPSITPLARPTTSSGLTSAIPTTHASRPLPPASHPQALASRPAFVVSSSVPGTPLSLAPGPPAIVKQSSLVASAESQARQRAQEAEQRRLTKEQEKAAKLAEAQAIAAEAAEKERKRREQVKAQLAQAKAEKEQQAKAKAEAEALAAKQAAQKQKDLLAKRAKEKEELERVKKQKEEEEAAAAIAAAAEAKKKSAAASKKRATATPTTAVQPASDVSATSTVPAASVPPIEATVAAPPIEVAAEPVASISPTLTAAAGTKPKRKPVPPKPEMIEFGVQTEFVSSLDSTSASIAALRKKFGAPTPTELAEDESEARELAAMSQKDQLAKLLLDLRYAKLRIRGLDEETASQLHRLQQQKDQLALQGGIISEQNKELSVWREEAKKMVSTGLEEGEKKQPMGGSRDESIVPVDPFSSSNPSLPIPPPPILSSVLQENESFMLWLRQVFTHMQTLEKRRKDAERVTAETVEMGRQAEMNLIQAILEKEKMQTQLAAVLRGNK